MSVETPVETPRVRDAASCRAWLARLAQGDSGRLLQVDRLLRGLVRSTQAPDLVLEIAEQARPVHLAELAGVIDRLDARQFPLADSDRARLLTALESLRLGRNLYKQIHTELVGASEAATRTVIPGAANSLRVVMPLARALDYQTRLLIALQRLKVAVEPADWDELCTLARHLRVSTFIDTKLPDEAPLLSAGTSRALFVYPLLVWLASPYVRSPAEFALATRLARRWSGRVGFRLEDGAGSRDTRHGPSVALTEQHTVRLVTHRLQRRIESRLRELEALGKRAVPRLPRGLTLADTRRLLTELTRQWCEPRSMFRIPDAALGEMQLRFGFPELPEAPPGSAPAAPADGALRGRGAGARSRQAPRRTNSWHSAASRAYIYGRFENNTLIRMALGGAPPPDPLSRWADDAQRAEWVSIERQQAVFEGDFAGPGIRLGALALVVPPAMERDHSLPGRHPLSEPSPKRIFGRVVSLSQSFPSDARRPARLRVSITVWSGLPALVGVRSGEDPFFHDAYLLSPDPATGEPTCLVLPFGRFHGPDVASLREADRDCRIRFEELLDRGPDYDRVRITRLPG
jgi:hypothetical protein